MKPFFAVQMTDRHDSELHATVDALKLIGADYALFGLIHFTDDITNLEAFPIDRPVIPLGGTKLIGMYHRGKLPGNWHVFYDEAHFDQYVSEVYYGAEMLNSDAVFREYSELRHATFDEHVFVKPTDDLKVFGGTLLEPGQSLDDALKKLTHRPIADDQMLMVSAAKNLGREIRLVVVGGRIVDASEYRNRGQVKAKAITDSETFRVTAEYFRKVQQDDAPAAYVMDIGELLTHDGPVWKIVELNCIHASGLYKCDRARVYREIAQLF
jgi:hypothetical protein